MPITKTTWKTLQSLAALECDDSEHQTLCQHLDVMLQWLDALPQATSCGHGGVSPAATDVLDSGVSQAASNESLREDLVQDSLPRSAVLRNSPDSQSDCYRVPPCDDRDQ